MSNTTIKSKLTDEEKKKVDKLTSLSNAKTKKSTTSATKEGSKINKTSSLAPVTYTKVNENVGGNNYKESLQTASNDYFKDLLESEDVEYKTTTAVMPPVIREGETNSSNNIVNMPHKEEISQNYYEKPQNLEQLFSNLDAINNSHEGKTDYDYYKEFLPEVKESLGLEKLEEINIDENKIKKDAENSLKNVYDLKRAQMASESEREIESEKLAQENLIATAEANKDEIEKIYDDAKIASSNESLKRGLARSSIAVLSINGLEQSKVKELSDMVQNLSAELSESERNISILRDEFATALENLDIEYAIELQDNLKSEVESLYKKQKEVIEFNNNVDKLEADYQTKRSALLEDRREMEESLAEEYKGVAERTRAETIEEAVMDYLSSMTKAEAIQTLVNDPRFFDYLGTGFYDVYYNLMRK